jgi:hypothetical protein
MSREITPSLKATLCELDYKEGCDQKGWAYISPKDIDIKGKSLSFHFLYELPTTVA